MKKRVSLKALSLLLCVAFVFGLASCAGQTPADTEQSSEHSTSQSENTGEEDMTEQRTSIATLTPSSGKKLKIAFVGDSITQGVGAGDYDKYSFPAQFRGLIDQSKYEVGNFGRGSSYVIPLDSKYHTAYHKQHPELAYKNTQQYKDSVAFKPDVVVIMLGVNDVRSMSDAGGWDAIKQANIDLANEYKAMDSVQKVYISTSIRICNAAAIIQGCDGPLQDAQRRAAQEGGFELIDIYADTHDYMNVMMHFTADRVHPNAEIYGRMALYYQSVLFGEEHTVPTPAKSESGVVYLRDGGKRGKGESPENAVGTLAEAVGLLRDGGGKIVICGPYSTTYETHLPEHTGTITITTNHDGKDHAALSGAKLTLKHNLYLYGDCAFESLPINVGVNASFIACNYNNVKFGDGITCTLASGINSYPLILAGYNIGLGGTPIEDASLHGECNIEVNSGTWAYVKGGNRRSATNLTVGGSDADAKLNITVNGGRFTNSSGVNFSAATGQNSFAGEAVFTINGGSFAGDVYAVCRVGGNTTETDPKMTGTVKLIINGGEFAGKIGAVQDGTVTVTGKVSAEVLEKYAAKLVGFTEITKK